LRAQLFAAFGLTVPLAVLEQDRPASKRQTFKSAKASPGAANRSCPSHHRAATRPIHVSSNSCVCWLAMRRRNGTIKPTRSAVRNAPDSTGDRFMKVALYARYSSDNRRARRSRTNFASAVPIPRSRVGKSLRNIPTTRFPVHRFCGPVSKRLLPTPCRRRFQVVLVEAMDRLSRDQEDIAGVFKRMAYANVKIVTLFEGDVTHLHVGLKGTMNDLPIQPKNFPCFATCDTGMMLRPNRHRQHIAGWYRRWLRRTQRTMSRGRFRPAPACASGIGAASALLRLRD
jgi:hypothetical protein